MQFGRCPSPPPQDTARPASDAGTSFALLFAILAGGMYLWDTYHGLPWLYVVLGGFALYLVYLEMKMGASVPDRVN